MNHLKSLLTVLVSFACLHGVQAQAQQIREDLESNAKSDNLEVFFPTGFPLQPFILIDPNVETGPIRPMNGTTGGPQGVVGYDLYKEARIPYARLHDIGSSGNLHIVEIMQIFPDFDADENDPASYDFDMTDEYIGRLVSTGTKVIWRLGNSHHEPSQLKKYGAWPPSDFAKWARVCEHVIRHYNEGWADGFEWNIDMWEIWNEPDLDQRLLPASENILPKDKGKVGKELRYGIAPHAWGGTMEQYYDFMATVINHLHKAVPNVRIGGPAFSSCASNEPFVKAMNERGAKLDFYTWHRYGTSTSRLVAESITVRLILDSYGWYDTITILDEWNYGSAGSAYSKEVRNNFKGTAYVAAAMCDMQNNGAADIMTYYDFRPRSSYNGAFDKTTGEETSTYHVFANWGIMLGYGTQVRTFCHNKPGDIYAVAAKDGEGNFAMMVSRCNIDNTVTAAREVTIQLPAGCKDPVCYLSDEFHKNCEYPFVIDKGNLMKINMDPNSVIFIQFHI